MGHPFSTYAKFWLFFTPYSPLHAIVRYFGTPIPSAYVGVKDTLNDPPPIT